MDLVILKSDDMRRLQIMIKSKIIVAIKRKNILISTLGRLKGDRAAKSLYNSLEFLKNGYASYKVGEAFNVAGRGQVEQSFIVVQERGCAAHVMAVPIIDQIGDPKTFQCEVKLTIALWASIAGSGEDLCQPLNSLETFSVQKWIFLLWKEWKRASTLYPTWMALNLQKWCNITAIVFLILRTAQSFTGKYEALTKAQRVGAETDMPRCHKVYCLWSPWIDAAWDDEIASTFEEREVKQST